MDSMGSVGSVGSMDAWVHGWRWSNFDVGGVGDVGL